MVKVNPPPHVPTPESIKRDKGLLAWSQAIDRILFQLWNRSGGGEDLNSTLQAQITALQALHDYTLYGVSRTTEGNEFFNATTAINITLRAGANNDEFVTVYINGGTGTTVTDGAETDTFFSGWHCFDL